MKSLNGDLQMRSDWNLPICNGKERLKDEDGVKIHPTQKPESLISRILLASTNVNDTILDPFFGTGTTGAVAKKLNRNFIGIEQDLNYVVVNTGFINYLNSQRGYAAKVYKYDYIKKEVIK